MEDQYSSEELRGNQYSKNNQIVDYQNLLIRLKKIKESISLLETNFSQKKF